MVANRADRPRPRGREGSAAGAADRRSFDAGDAYVTGATPDTERDEAWLRSGPLSKALDPNLRWCASRAGVPERHTRVLSAASLRRTLSVARPKPKASKHNPPGDRLVPWPNTFWLCCPI